MQIRIWVVALTLVLAVPSMALALDADTKFQDGLAAAEKGNFQQAMMHFSRAIELDPTQSDFYVQRGKVQVQLGRLAGALADFDRALALNPRHAGAWLARARVRTVMGDPKGAEADRARAIELNPGLFGLEGEGGAPGAEELAAPAEVVVRLREDGSVMIGDRTVGKGGLAAALQAASGGRAESSILITAHASVTYSRVQAVIDACQSLGLDRISLSALEETDPSGEPPVAPVPLKRYVRVRIRYSKKSGAIAWDLQDVRAFPDAKTLARALGDMAQREKQSGSGPLEVGIDADDNVPFQAVVEILNALVAEKIEDVHFVAPEREEKKKERHEPRPAIDCKVVAVRAIENDPEHPLVLLNVGSGDGLTKGRQLTIYRDDEFIAKVIVEKVMTDMAGCRVLFVADGESVREGDMATTSLK